MKIRIHGQVAKTVQMGGTDHALLDVDKARAQAQIVVSGRPQWVAIDRLTFGGKSFETRHIRFPNPSGKKCRKSRPQESLAGLQTA